MRTSVKTCFKCGEQKELSQFYKHPMMADGHVNKCKECNKKDVRENRTAKAEYYKQSDRNRADLPHRVAARKEYQSTRGGKEAVARGRKKYTAKNPHKRKASHVVNNAVRGGKLLKLPCEVCGSTVRIHGHHDDYEKPLEVVWLCAAHHSQRHKQLREQERKMTSEADKKRKKEEEDRRRRAADDDAGTTLLYHTQITTSYSNDSCSSSDSGSSSSDSGSCGGD